MPINGVIINMTSWQSAFPLLPGFSVSFFFLCPTNLCLSVCVAFLGLASDIPGLVEWFEWEAFVGRLDCLVFG